MNDCILKAACYNYSDVACNLIPNPERECGFYQTFIKRLLECDTCDRAPYSCSTCGVRLEKEYDWSY